MADFSTPASSQRSPLTLAALAIVALTAIAVVVVLLQPGPSVVATVKNVQLFAPHTQFESMRGEAGTHVIQTNPSSEDDLYVVATVHLANKLHRPLTLTSSSASLITPEGTQMTPTVIAARDLPRLEETFPALTPMLTHPLPSDADVPAQGSLDGSIVLLFPTVGAQVWSTKKSAHLTLEFEHENPVSIELH
jgi:hypothetical protein